MFEFNGESILTIDEPTTEYVLNEIGKFKNTLGGTNIIDPLTRAQEDFQSDLKKRIFILTDGAVDNPDRVIEQVKLHSDKIRVMSFGIGDCDSELVRKIAEAGRGTHTIA